MSGQLLYFISLAFFAALVVYLERKYEILQDNSVSGSRPYSLGRSQLLWWTLIVLSSLVAVVWGAGELPDLTESTLVLLGIGALTTVSSNILDISDRRKTPPANTIQPGTPESAAPAPVVQPAKLSQDSDTEGFWFDVLSDQNGVSVHRLQAVVFNLVFGIWFIYEVFVHIKGIGPNTLPSYQEMLDRANFITGSHDSMPTIASNVVDIVQRKIAALSAQAPTPSTSAMITKLRTLLNETATPINDILPVFSTNNLILMGMSAGTYIALKSGENSTPSTNTTNTPTPQPTPAPTPVPPAPVTTGA